MGAAGARPCRVRHDALTAAVHRAAMEALDQGGGGSLIAAAAALQQEVDELLSQVRGIGRAGNTHSGQDPPVGSAPQSFGLLLRQRASAGRALHQPCLGFTAGALPAL